MMRVRKLIEEGKALDLVGVFNLLQILVQGCWIARDIDNVVEFWQELHSDCIQACSRWVHKQCPQLEL